MELWEERTRLELRLLGVLGPDPGPSVKTVFSIVSVLPLLVRLWLVAIDLEFIARFSPFGPPCSNISTKGDFMTGLDPQTRNRFFSFLSSVVAIVQSSLEATICV